MEKRTPHYPLSLVKRLLERGQFIVTLEARITGARDFSINDMDDFRRYLLNLAHRDFYKSMTTLKDHRVWQDVYHLEVGNAQAYVKVQVLNENAVLISFKTLLGLLHERNEMGGLSNLRRKKLHALSQ